MKAVENRSPQERTEAMQAVRNDMEGLLSLGEFTETYVRFTRHAPEHLLDEIVEDIRSLAGSSALVPLRILRDDVDAEYCVISCGTVNLIERYLLRMDVRRSFGALFGKTFEIIDGRIGDISIAVSGPQDKAFLLEAEAARIASRTGIRPLTIAVGDGPTDIPMLRHADFGIIVDWDEMEDTTERSGFPLARSVDGICTLVRDFLATKEDCMRPHRHRTPRNRLSNV